MLYGKLLLQEMEQLLTAARDGDVTILQYLLETVAMDVNAKGGPGWVRQTVYRKFLCQFINCHFALRTLNYCGKILTYRKICMGHYRMKLEPRCNNVEKLTC